MQNTVTYILGGMFITTIALAFVTVITDIATSEPPPCHNYTIWQGSAAFAVGYGVNSLTEENGAYIVGDTLLPKTGTYKVDRNNCEEE